MVLEKSVQSSTDPNIAASLDSLKARLREVGRIQPEGTPVSSSWQKAIYTTIPWTVLGVLILLAPGANTKTAILGMAVFAVPFTVVNFNLPDFQPTWINYWLIPWAEVLLVVGTIVGRQRWKANAV